MNNRPNFYKETFKNYLNKYVEFENNEKIGDYIGSGSFGVVYSCKASDEKENSYNCAIKLEVSFLFEN
jgi:hypothetical protein